MRRIILLMMLAIVSSSANAETGFTCEKIKDKATRKSCIDDRVEKGKSTAENGKAVVKEEAKITSTCAMNEIGHAECTFKNSGNAKGSTCGRFVLMPKDGEGKGDSLFAKYKYVLAEKKIALDNAIKDNAKKYFAKQNRNIGFTSKDDLEEVIDLLYSEKMIVSDQEICSGIVEPGDIRQVTATVTFFRGRNPHFICVGADFVKDTWSDGCSFTTISTEKVLSMLNEELNK